MAENIKTKIIEIFAESSGVSADRITEDTRLVADLGLTSFGLVDIVVNAEEEFGVSIPDEYLKEIQTVGDAIRIVEKVID